MNFDLNEDQRMLVDTAAAFAKKESPVSRARKMRELGRGWDPQVWKQMGELGLLALPFPEEVGGIGGSFVDLALVIEQLGATLVPEPIIASVVLAGMAVLRAGSKEQRAKYLTTLCRGESALALAVGERDNRFDVHRASVRAQKKGRGYMLGGEKTWVLNGQAAEHIVVSAMAPGGLSLFVVPAAACTVQMLKTMDGRHAAHLVFADSEAELLGAEGSAGPVLAEVFDRAAAAACAEGAGIMRTVLAMTVEYLGVREQFGVKIGTFQALQHRAVDMFIETELAKSTMILAAIKADAADAEERAYAISQAKVQLAVSGCFVVQQATQLHGGIGVTDEHDVGLYFKRMHALSTLFGDESFHLQRFTQSPTFAAV